MGKHTAKRPFTADMPKDVKVVWGIGIGVIVGSVVVVLLIPAFILLIAFPESLFLIAFLVVVLIGGYIKARKH